MDGRSFEGRFILNGQDNVFDEQAQQYDAWFDAHPAIYQSELAALRKVVSEDGLEIGIGTGRFALPLEIKLGLDPSVAMLSIARGRGMGVVRGIAEQLPFKDNTFDLVLFVTTLCFVSDPLRALAEAKRVISNDGRIVIGLIDDGGPMGKAYAERVSGRAFYRGAIFRSAEQVLSMLRAVGLSHMVIFQTIFHDPKEMTVPDLVLPGHGKGLFVVIAAK